MWTVTCTVPHEEPSSLQGVVLFPASIPPRLSLRPYKPAHKCLVFCHVTFHSLSCFSSGSCCNPHKSSGAFCSPSSCCCEYNNLLLLLIACRIIEGPLSHCDQPSIWSFSVQGLKNVTVTEGDSVTLECQISGQPTPVIMWFREDYQIESSIDFQISYKDGIARMLIREAFAEDSGRFTCTATNEAGTVSTSCYLLVKGNGFMKSSS